MSWLDRFRKQEPSELTKERAMTILKSRGFWEPASGTRAALNPKLFFPYSEAIAFAIDSDATIPDDRRQVLLIHGEQDFEMYSDPKIMAEAIAVGYCTPKHKGHRFVVVRRK